MLIDQDKITRIFYECDEFCREFEEYMKSKAIGKGRKSPNIYASEVMTILILYHLSGMKCFQYFYHHIVEKKLRVDFPVLPSYNRFVELEPRVFLQLFLFVNYANPHHEKGVYIVDSKHLKVCHNRRIHSHKVFKGIAQRGKTSVGWFYGIKLFLIVNLKGEVMRATVAAGNVADNSFEYMKTLFAEFKGVIMGDKGFLSSKAFTYFFENGLKILTKLKNNMKNKLMDMNEKLMLKKRGLIECIFDLLVTICDIDHTRHRSPQNAFCNLFAGLAAYNYLERKPSIFNKTLSIK